jgi:hypothetical protein
VQKEPKSIVDQAWTAIKPGEHNNVGRNFYVAVGNHPQGTEAGDLNQQ